MSQWMENIGIGTFIYIFLVFFIIFAILIFCFAYVYINQKKDKLQDNKELINKKKDSKTKKYLKKSSKS